MATYRNIGRKLLFSAAVVDLADEASVKPFVQRVWETVTTVWKGRTVALAGYPDLKWF